MMGSVHDGVAQTCVEYFEVLSHLDTDLSRSSVCYTVISGGLSSLAN